MSTKYNPTPERERPHVFSCDEKESAQAQADRPTSKRMVQRVLAVTTEPNEMGTPLPPPFDLLTESLPRESCRETKRWMEHKEDGHEA